MPEANVRVICRFRPANDRERRENVSAKQAEGLVLDIVDNKTIQVTMPSTKELLTFTFDHVFNESAAQKQVYEITARDTVNDILDGYNGTIFAYGQTGAGKTYTMTSNLGYQVNNSSSSSVQSQLEQRGIIPRACSQLFNHIEKDDSGTEYTIKCSFLEIYKEGLRDLLEPQNNSKLKIRETPAKGVWVEGLTEAFVGSEADIFQLLQLGESSRSVASTNMNAVSSRSHTLFVITLIQKLKDGSTKTSRLNLADLAGSEKVGKTGASGETLEEAKKINQSLSALGNCIVALTKSPEKRKHVPYRDSKLTFVLRESLGGNSKTTLLIACSPHLYNLEETISTLRFGQRAKSIKNSVRINAHRSVAELEIIVSKLQNEVSRLRAYSKCLEKELQTKSGENEVVDFSVIQEKALKMLRSESESKTSNTKPQASNKALVGSSITVGSSIALGSSSAVGSSIANSLHPKEAHEKSSNNKLESNPRRRAGSHQTTTSSPSPSSSSSTTTLPIHNDILSFSEWSSDGTRSDGLRSPASEDYDDESWAPMNMVDAQLAYDKLKEEMEFKLQDVLEELAQAREESGIEEYKARLTRELEDFKTQYKNNTEEMMIESKLIVEQIKQKLQIAQNQSNEIIGQIEHYQTQIEERESKIEQLKREIDVMAKEHAKEQQENNQQNLKNNQEMLTMKATIDTLNNDLEHYMSQLLIANEENQAKNKEIVEMNEKIETLKARIEGDLEIQKQQLEQEKIQLQEEIQKQQLEYEKKLMEAQNQHTKLESEKNALENEKVELGTIRSNLESQLSSQDIQISSLNTSLSNESQKKIELSEQISNLKNQVFQSNSKIDFLSSQLDESRSQIDQKSQECSNLLIEREKLKQQLEGVLEKLDLKETSILQLSHNLASTERYLDETKSMNQSQTEELKVLKEQLEVLRRSEQKLEVKLSDAANQIEKQDKANDEGMKLLGELNKSLTDKNQILFSEKETIYIQLNETIMKLNLANAEIESLKKSLQNELQTQQSTFETKISNLNHNLSNKDQEISTLKEEIDKLKKDEKNKKANFSAKLSEMQAKIEQYQEKYHELELKLKEKERDLVNEQKSTLQAQISAEKQKVAFEQSKVEVEKSKTEVEKIKLEIEKSKVEVEKYKLEASQSHLQIANIKNVLEKQILEQKHQHQNQISQLESKHRLDIDHLNNEHHQASSTQQKRHESEIQFLQDKIDQISKTNIDLDFKLKESLSSYESLKVEHSQTSNELDDVRQKLNQIEKDFENASQQINQLSGLLQTTSDSLSSIKIEYESYKIDTLRKQEENTKRENQLADDLTEARVSLRRLKEDLAAEQEAHQALIQSSRDNTAPSTPSKQYTPSGVIAKDPNTPALLDTHFLNPLTSKVNSRIAVPITHSLAQTGAAGLLSSATKSTNSVSRTRPTSVAASILNTPSLLNSESSEKSDWINVVMCVGKGPYSTGWKKLWVVAKDRKITFFEADQKTIIEVVQLRGCQLLQLPNTSRSLVDQQYDNCCVIISNSASGEETQDEYALASESSEMIEQWVQYLLKIDCEPLAFSTLRLETAQAAPIVNSPANNNSKSAFSRFAPSSSSSSSNNQNAPRSFLSGLFG